MGESVGLKKGRQIITVPNLLSLCRILLIPIFIWLYACRGEFLYAAGILLLSSVTDIADGFIARKFHLVSELGKLLDPLADKLTQAAVLLCLSGRFPAMYFLTGLLVIKELITGLVWLIAARRRKGIQSAEWHGKAAACLLCVTMLLHIIWTDIPPAVSICTTAPSALMMIISFVLYILRSISVFKKDGGAGAGRSV